jgi:hypothetical protein
MPSSAEMVRALPWSIWAAPYENEATYFLKILRNSSFQDRSSSQVSLSTGQVCAKRVSVFLGHTLQPHQQEKRILTSFVSIDFVPRPKLAPDFIEYMPSRWRNGEYFGCHSELHQQEMILTPWRSIEIHDSRWICHQISSSTCPAGTKLVSVLP